MMKKIAFLFVLVMYLPAQDTMALPRKAATREPGFECRLLDFNARIYTDQFPTGPAVIKDISVPRNYELMYQLAMRAAVREKVLIELMDLKNQEGTLFKGELKVYNLLPVHIEGNTQGSLINRPGGPAPGIWRPYFVREAPFDVFEVPVESQTRTMEMKPGVVGAALIKIRIPENCRPGLYSGRILLKGKHTREVIPVSFNVHQTVVPRAMALNSVHWLSERPEDLTSGSPPLWWSSAHWNLLKAAGIAMRSNGDNMMYTPLINGRFPLIQSYIDVNKNISFDYSRFDHWIKMYSELGFQFFSGKHLDKLFKDVYFKDKVKGGTLEYADATQLDWFAFLEIFLKDFNRHLEKNNWKTLYIQHVYDEPADLEKYKTYAALLQKCMPGTRSIDAINSRPALYSDLVDAQVFNFTGINLQKYKTVKERIARQKSVWLYNCSSPYPPYPNRHLDLPLVENRLWPLLCYKYGASGYLWWAANWYRGVKDEYAGSLGPGPGGDLVHPPGDAWLYYRSASGLLPSLRILAFKEGMIDVTLLKMLDSLKSHAEVEALLAEVILPEIALGHERPFNDYLTRAKDIQKGYSTDPLRYAQLRARVLSLLDAFGSTNPDSTTITRKL